MTVALKTNNWLAQWPMFQEFCSTKTVCVRYVWEGNTIRKDGFREITIVPKENMQMFLDKASQYCTDFLEEDTDCYNEQMETFIVAALNLCEVKPRHHPINILRLNNRIKEADPKNDYSVNAHCILNSYKMLNNPTAAQTFTFLKQVEEKAQFLLTNTRNYNAFLNDFILVASEEYLKKTGFQLPIQSPIFKIYHQNLEKKSEAGVVNQ